MLGDEQEGEGEAEQARGGTAEQVEGRGGGIWGQGGQGGCLGTGGVGDIYWGSGGAGGVPGDRWDWRHLLGFRRGRGGAWRQVGLATSIGGQEGQGGCLGTGGVGDIYWGSGGAGGVPGDRWGWRHLLGVRKGRGLLVLTVEC